MSPMILNLSVIRHGLLEGPHQLWTASGPRWPHAAPDSLSLILQDNDKDKNELPASLSADARAP